MMIVHHHWLSLIVVDYHWLSLIIIDHHLLSSLHWLTHWWHCKHLTYDGGWKSYTRRWRSWGLPGLCGTWLRADGPVGIRSHFICKCLWDLVAFLYLYLSLFLIGEVHDMRSCSLSLSSPHSWSMKIYDLTSERSLGEEQKGRSASAIFLGENNIILRLNIRRFFYIICRGGAEGAGGGGGAEHKRVP